MGFKPASQLYIYTGWFKGENTTFSLLQTMYYHKIVGKVVESFKQDAECVRQTTTPLIINSISK